MTSGIEDWLDHHGITLDETLVMDPQNSAFPVPVTRQVGGFSFQDVRMLDYPYFVDVRDQGLNQEVAITRELPSITFAWGSPIDIDAEKNAARTVTTLMSSSQSSWRSSSTDIMPKIGADGSSPFAPEGEQGPNVLAVILEGRFESFFDASPLLETADDEGESDAAAGDEEDAEVEEAGYGSISTVIGRSPESARLILIGSSAFVADQTIRMIGSADGTLYANSIQMMANPVDWAVEDQSLLSIRSRGHFNRTLPPMAVDEQRIWEFVNYGVAAAGLVGIFGVNRRRRAGRRREYAKWLENA